jgi:hypothetical protein
MAIIFSSGTQSAPTKVIQVVKLDYSAPYASGTSMTSYTDMSGWSKAITTLAANSKILINVNFGYWHGDTNGYAIAVKRSGTLIGVGNANGSRDRASFRTTHQNFDGNHSIGMQAWSFLDEPSQPSGTTLTYQLMGKTEGASNFYINRSSNYQNESLVYAGTFHSSIILTEISA